MNFCCDRVRLGKGLQRIIFEKKFQITQSSQKYPFTLLLSYTLENLPVRGNV